MAITTITTATRNAIADLIDDLINTGSTDATGDFQILDDPIVAVEIAFQNPAFGAAASGVITLAGVPLSAAATASVPLADLALLRNRNNVEVVRGDVTLGGTGAVTLTNTNIASGQTVRITAGTVTVPASVTV